MSETTLSNAEKIALLNQFGETWGNGDIDGLMNLMSDDCVYAASVGDEPGTTYRGQAEVRRGFTDIIAFESGGESRSGRVWVSGDYAFAEWSYDDNLPDGTVIDVKGIDIFAFNGDKIRLKDAYRKTTY